MSWLYFLILHCIFFWLGIVNIEKEFKVWESIPFMDNIRKKNQIYTLLCRNTRFYVQYWNTKLGYFMSCDYIKNIWIMLLTGEKIDLFNLGHTVIHSKKCQIFIWKNLLEHRSYSTSLVSNIILQILINDKLGWI